MKRIALFGVLAAAIAICFCLTGCDDDSTIPTKTGGGGKSQYYIPKGNKHGGKYLHVPKN